MARSDDVAASVELVAVALTVEGDIPQLLIGEDASRLPAGPLRSDTASLQTGVRDFVQEQTGHVLGFVEQLYTFADSGRSDAGRREVSISYLGLTRAEESGGWLDLYQLLPWEDHRPDAIDATVARLSDIGERLEEWTAQQSAADDVRRRVDFLFGRGHPWRPELALQRYEVLWQAGLVAEANPTPAGVVDLTGPALYADHRRIVATGLSRLRATLQYRPVVFELLPEQFTLSRLQEVVEALAGSGVHTQNFRRLVQQQHALVEPTGELATGTGGRPAQLFQFRPAVFTEREFVGTKLPNPRPR